MKEYHHSFITAAALFFSAERAGEAVQFMINNPCGVIVYYLITIIALGLVLRGLYVMLPFPLSGLSRIDFDDAHPDAYLKTRSQRVLLYKQWRKNEANKSQHPTASS
ncbi:hypothetical protein HW115_18965 [Verrucomicrobiaceae bacterium N1E253]|uniref:Uncharacterized protein n=1 Tax=Oceaniferula marina TaxID=2748318 RepID=A0A851GRQ8_9BACT|nr:hypothetical protein [Oceaniferula marina]NWK57707.1 hypothetical protein [Oceaniferula marina]